MDRNAPRFGRRQPRCRMATAEKRCRAQSAGPSKCRARAPPFDWRPGCTKHPHTRCEYAGISGRVSLATATIVFADGEQAKATLKNAQGQTVGDATLTETPHGVLILVRLTSAPAGVHAFHIHAAGKCEPPFA